MTKKTQLNKARRDIIEEYGLKYIESRIDRTKEKSLLQRLADFANTAIRTKYPDADMAVLRAYGVIRTDRCIRFQFPSGRVDGQMFPNDISIADMPQDRGCYQGEVFAVPAECEEVFDAHAKEFQDNYRLNYETRNQFISFLRACKSVEDVLEVIDLPTDIRDRVDHRSTALVAVSPESVTALRETFRIAA
jgi:hypothetical protein